MVADVSAFVTIAEIAGVFVGFAALIAVTRRSDIDATQLGQIRAVVTVGLQVVVAALVPVALGAYGVEGRGLWVAAALVYLALNGVVIGLALRRAENRQLAGTQARATPIMAALFWLLEAGVQVPLLLVVVGVGDVDLALYLTALVVHLFEASLILAQLVYAQLDRTEA